VSAFLTYEEVSTLTGRKTKSKQIETLRKMGVPFFVNAADRPVVLVSAIEGRKDATPPPKAAWVPKVLRN